MPVTLKRTYSDAAVARMLPALLLAAENIQGHDIVQKELERRGVEIDEDEGIRLLSALPNRKQIEILIDHFLFTLTLRYEDVQREQARSAAVRELIDGFEGGGDGE